MLPHQPLPTATPAPSPVPAQWRRADNGTVDITSLRGAPATFSARPSGTNGSTSTTNGFYNNQLFYILIAVLGAFALISLVNLIRTRRRRRIILREAERLGLMVPGMPGYVPMRERPAFTKADGWRTPDWWEVEPDVAGEAGSKARETGTGGAGGGEGTGSGGGGAGGAAEDGTSTGVGAHELGETDQQNAGAQPAASPIAEKSEVEHVETDPTRGKETATAEPAVGEYRVRGRLELPPLPELAPLALIPQPEVIHEPPKPWSAIPYFPNYVSYLRSAHDPKPPRFNQDDPDTFNSLVGDQVQVVVALRMPTLERPKPEGAGEDDDDAVIREWSGLELGVASVSVVA